MNIRELREEAWDIARETATVDSQRLWTTKEMNRYINRVYRYIARETRCIRDDITTDICRIVSDPPADIATLQTLALTDVYAAQDLAWYNGTGWLSGKLVAPYIYPLSPLIIDIDEVKWTTRAWKLTRSSVTRWQTNVWWEQVTGMPTEYATDLANNTIALNFRSLESDTLKLIVRRLPLADLISDTDTPEFKTHYHDFMVNGILWQMYSKQDAEAFDKTAADKYYGMFLRDVDEIKQQESIMDNRLKPNYAMSAFR